MRTQDSQSLDLSGGKDGSMGLQGDPSLCHTSIRLHCCSTRTGSERRTRSIGCHSCSPLSVAQLIQHCTDAMQSKEPWHGYALTVEWPTPLHFRYPNPTIVSSSEAIVRWRQLFMGHSTDTNICHLQPVHGTCITANLSHDRLHDITSITHEGSL